VDIELHDLFKRRIGSDIPSHIIDELVLSEANILRPVKGHAFEVIFDRIVSEELGGRIEEVGGDSSIDRIFHDKNGQTYTLQLKTPVTNTIKLKDSFQVTLHKTHGTEKRPKNLYPTSWPCRYCEHDGDDFPQFLIVFHPESGVLIIPKEEIPESSQHPGHFASPIKFEWDDKWLNRWDLLGHEEFKGVSLERRLIEDQKLFPKISSEVLLTDEEILKMWLKPENFRMIDMNLKGNLREPLLTNFLKSKGVIALESTIPYSKYDRIIEKNGIRIQIKGPSRHLTNTKKNIIGAEVMGTHGYGAIRRYSTTDFDYFGFVIDPGFLPTNNSDLNISEYHFCFIPAKALPLHYKNDEWDTRDKIYDTSKFTVKEDENGVYLTPATNYQNQVRFRVIDKWYVDEVPNQFYV